MLQRHGTHSGAVIPTVERFWRLVGEFPAELRMGPRGEGGGQKAEVMMAKCTAVGGTEARGGSHAL